MNPGIQATPTTATKDIDAEFTAVIPQASPLEPESDETPAPIQKEMATEEPEEPEENQADLHHGRQ